MKDFDDYAGMSSGEKANCIERDLATLKDLLEAWDCRKCNQEAKAYSGKGLPNFYRLGHLTRAAEKAASLVSRHGWHWVTALCQVFEQEDGLFVLAPVRMFVNRLAARRNGGAKWKRPSKGAA